MNETKKIMTVLIVAVVAIVGIIILNFVSGKQNKKTVEKYEEMMNTKTEKLIYIGRPTCSYCQQLEPNLKEITDMYNIKYEYINTDSLSQSVLTKVLKVFDTDTSTPQLFVVKDGKIVKEQQGYTDRDGVFKFLQDGGMIKKDEKLESVDANLTQVDYAKYEEAINSSENKIIVIGQTGCSYCEAAKPVLSAMAKEYSMEINYLNLTNLSEEESTKVITSLDVFKEDFGTPLIMIVKNKKVIDSIQGFESKEKYVEFFEKTGFIK